jgi:NTP pyrophosphatase (non-canonical NTP hydrolase)
MYKDIHEAISTHQDIEAGLNGPTIRLMKLSEEVGEVAEAYIGFVGANKRKGYTHTHTDIADELCDVVITAMVAMYDWVDDPEQHLEDKLQTLMARIEKDGS